MDGHSFDFKNLAVDNLVERLRRFYASLRTVKGDLYSKSTFVGICASINRHLRDPVGAVGKFHSQTATTL